MLRLEHLKLQQTGFVLTANWSVAPGERIAIIGPSGAGKSSLLLALAGFLPLAEGRILWNDQDLAATAPGDRPLSMLFQDQNLFPHLTVLQNLGFGLSPCLQLTASQTEQIDAVLTQVGLQGLGNRRSAQLSGGQQGRVALARALLRARPLLLLDEPFAALGPALKSEMLALLDTVATRTGAAVLMVTHDPNDAKRFADKSVLVANGIAHPPMGTFALFANPPAALAEYLGDST